MKERWRTVIKRRCVNPPVVSSCVLVVTDVSVGVFGEVSPSGSDYEFVESQFFSFS